MGSCYRIVGQRILDARTIADRTMKPYAEGGGRLSDLLVLVQSAASISSKEDLVLTRLLKKQNRLYLINHWWS